ncbi:glycoside hydrolase family 97 N-terminal domain-containing protein, partial [Novipirellula sp.]|uniref:glycoside hydrolase family 97 N-terminal domain-containing protein n=1 Tax=Novipirellula sp. TaxID=2795430 RepID=UPI0035672BC3
MTSIRKSSSFLTVCLLMLVLPDRGLSAEEVMVSSPSGNHVIQFSLRDGVPHYRVSYQDKTILSDSSLSLNFEGDPWSDRFVVESTRTEAQSGSWVPVVGSKSSYPDAYNECIVQLREASEAKRRLDLTFRAYDEGVAFRYTIPQQQDVANIKLVSEDSQFQFTDDHFVYWDDYPQAEYSKVRLSEM